MGARKYFKFDEINQFLEDEADINYFSTNQARRVAVGNMLGDFDENGYYVLDKKIVEQLIAMPKIIADSVEGADLIRSAIKFDNFLHFMVTFEEDKACLILLEKINFESNVTYNAGSYANMSEYVLDEIQIPDRDVDRTIVYTRFNIAREDEGKVYDINSLTPEEQLNFDAIINKMKYNYLAQNELLQNEKAIEKMEADYFDNILNSFDKYPKEKESLKLMLKKAILEKINFLQIEKPFFQKTVNEILDNNLRILLAKLTPEQREDIEKKIRKVKDKYYQEYNKIIHMQFISSLNVQKEVGQDNIISEVINANQTDIKVMKMGIDEKELENSLTSIMGENDQLREILTAHNSGEKTITTYNPELRQFFEEFKKEIGIDILKESPKTFEVKDRAEVKKPDVKKAMPEVKKSTVEATEKEQQKEATQVEPKKVEKSVERKSQQETPKLAKDTKNQERQQTVRAGNNSRTSYSGDYSFGGTGGGLVSKAGERTETTENKTERVTTTFVAKKSTEFVSKSDEHDLGLF